MFSRTGSDVYFAERKTNENVNKLGEEDSVNFNKVFMYYIFYIDKSYKKWYDKCAFTDLDVCR